MAVRFTILVLLTTAVVVVSSAGLLGEQHENVSRDFPQRTMFDVRGCVRLIKRDARVNKGSTLLHTNRDPLLGDNSIFDATTRPCFARNFSFPVSTFRCLN